LLGVRNSAADYSLGDDLLDPARKRPYTVFASWTDLPYRDDAYMASLPREGGKVFGVTVHTGQDRPVADADAFYAERSAQIAEMMRNTARFTRRPQGAIQKVAAAEP